MRAMLFVLAGGSFHVRFGETSGPSQVNFLGIISPAENPELKICSDIGPPFDRGGGVPTVKIEKDSNSTNRGTPFLPTTILLSLSPIFFLKPLQLTPGLWGLSTQAEPRHVIPVTAHAPLRLRRNRRLSIRHLPFQCDSATLVFRAKYSYPAVRFPQEAWDCKDRSH